jgi:hypothetical protein
MMPVGELAVTIVAQRALSLKLRGLLGLHEFALL